MTSLLRLLTPVPNVFLDSNNKIFKLPNVLWFDKLAAIAKPMTPAPTMVISKFSSELLLIKPRVNRDKIGNGKTKLYSGPEYQSGVGGI